MSRLKAIQEKIGNDTYKTVDVLISVFLRRVKSLAAKCHVEIESDLDKLRINALKNVGYKPKRMSLSDYSITDVEETLDELVNLNKHTRLFKKLFKESAISLLANLRSLQGYGKLSKKEIESIMKPLLSIEARRPK